MHDMYYAPVVRLGPVERELLERYPRDDRLLPIVEVVRTDYESDLERVDAAFGPGKYLISLPRYLVEYATRQRDDLKRMLNRLSEAGDPVEAFFAAVRRHRAIPVVGPASWKHEPIDYRELITRCSTLRPLSARLAFHLPVLPREPTASQAAQLRSLRDALAGGDIVLVDLVRVRPAAAAFRALKAVVALLRRRQDLVTLVLGGMDVLDWRELAIHNYGPVFCKELDLDGFGDYATCRRREPSGGPGARLRPVQKYVVYYSSMSHDLVRFGGDRYADAVASLRSHPFWTQAVLSRHIERCEACASVVRGAVPNDPTEWKAFRMNHYMDSILDETIPAMSVIAAAEQLDSRGYRKASMGV